MRDGYGGGGDGGGGGGGGGGEYHYCCAFGVVIRVYAVASWWQLCW